MKDQTFSGQSKAVFDYHTHLLHSGWDSEWATKYKPSKKEVPVYPWAEVLASANRPLRRVAISFASTATTARTCWKAVSSMLAAC